MSLDTAITALVSRLESVTARLEKVEKQLASGVLSAPAGPTSSSSGSAGADASDLTSVREFENLVNQYIRPFVELSGKIDPVVKQQAELVLEAVELEKAFIATAAVSKKPDAAVAQDLFKPTISVVESISALRDKNRTSKFFNNLSTVSEGIAALAWVLITPTPGPHVGDMRGGSEFYSNRILKDFKDKDPLQVDWVKAFNGFLKELQVYIKNYHTTGLTWNPSGGDAKATASAPPKASAPAPAPAPAQHTTPTPGATKAPDANALFSALNKGTDVTGGLKKVTAEMKTKNQPGRSSVVSATAPTHAKVEEKKEKAAPKKPPKFALEGNKWVVENQVDNKIEITETEAKQVVYIYGCVNTTVLVKGKVNAITVDGCKRTGVVFDNAISGVEVVNSQSLEIQVLGRVPSVAIDKTTGIQLYLSKQALEAEIVTSKSSEMNVLLPQEGDADLVELPIPEQYKTVVQGNKLVTECVHHAG